MARRGKKYVNLKKSQPKAKLSLNEGLDKVKALSYSKFDGSIELHLHIALPKDKDAKSLKGSVSLPNATSQKEVKIAVFTTPDRESVAKEAGADMTNMEALMKELKDGKINFDVAIATPDVMAQIAMLGKVLGPRGLMPNPRTGTVTDDLASAIAEYKRGKLNYRCDERGGVHVSIGTVKMTNEQLTANIATLIKNFGDVLGKRVGSVLKSAHIAPTMGASVEVELNTEE